MEIEYPEDIPLTVLKYGGLALLLPVWIGVVMIIFDDFEYVTYLGAYTLAYIITWITSIIVAWAVSEKVYKWINR